MYGRLGYYLAVLAIVLPGPAVADDSPPNSPSGPAVVYCHDLKRDLVSLMLASDCQGIVVSGAEAKAIKDRRDQAIARTMIERSRKSPEGMRLAKLGTAFFVDESGRLLTNNHVVVDCKLVTVHSVGRTPLNAQVLAVDPLHDLALLHTADESPGFAEFRSVQTAGMNAKVATVGYPEEGLPSIEPLITSGTLLRGDDGNGHIMISADIHSGNSGGPILDGGGLVIGIVNAKLDTARFFAQTGRQASDTGAGIALSTVLGFLRRTDTRYHVANNNETLDTSGLLKLASSFVARAECWE